MALYDPRPLSIQERRQRAEDLRHEAAKLTEEAERIETGIKDDEATMVALIKKAMQPYATEPKP